jgi:alkylhydroperoxidase/carboxymuconolactone decarboxylase family protein YurZ
VDERYEALLRRLAVLDEQTIAAALPTPAGHDRGLDARTTALVRLAGVVAVQSSPQTYEWGVAAALATGCSADEVVAALAALGPVVGAARVSSAAVNVAAAIGCHVDVAGQD